MAGSSTLQGSALFALSTLRGGGISLAAVLFVSSMLWGGVGVNINLLPLHCLSQARCGVGDINLLPLLCLPPIDFV